MKFQIKGSNQQARKLSIEDDDSFYNFCKEVKIDFTKSKISVVLQNNQNTLKDYLLLKHYTFSNLKPEQQRQQVKQINQDANKVNQTVSDNNSSQDKNKNDVLYISYQIKPGQVKKFKIKAGTLIFEQPFIILSMQDISSELNLNNLKMKSTVNDIIYIKSINEIRDKVVKIINIISSSRFFNLKTISNMNKIDKAQNDPYPVITIAQIEDQQLIMSKSQQVNSQIQEIQDFSDANNRLEELNDVINNPIEKSINDQITFQPHNNSQIHSFKQSADITPHDVNPVQNYQEPQGNNINTNNHESTKQEQTKQHQGDNSQRQQIFNSLQKSVNDTPLVKSNILLIPGQMIEQTQQTPQLPSQNLTYSQYKVNDYSFNQRVQQLKDKDEQSDGSDLKSINSNRSHSNPNQQMYQHYMNGKITKKKSFNQSFCEADSLQFIEDDDLESKVAYLKMSLSCLLNNTYSLLDYMILSNEKSYFKKLSVKPQQMSLKRLDAFLKSLFPNLIIQYQSAELQEKEIKTDVRRLKYILISVLSSFIYRKKVNDQSVSPSQKYHGGLQIAQYELNTPMSQNRKQSAPFQANNYEYDKLIEIYLIISLNEQQQFNSINFSIYTMGSLNLQFDNHANMMQNMNLQPPKYKQESISTPNSRNNKKSDFEILYSMTQANFCFNATLDPTINQMEARNIFCNIMRIGPYLPEYEGQSNLFQFDIFEDIEVIVQPQKNICSPNCSVQNLIQGMPSNHIISQQPKSIQNIQYSQYEVQPAKSTRKSNFFSGSISPQSIPSNIMSSENVRKKSGQQQKNKQNLKESQTKQKILQVHDMKQLEIAIIKENIQSLNEECYTDSYKTFVSGEDQEIEEHLQDSIFASRKLPRSIWDIQV